MLMDHKIRLVSAAPSFPPREDFLRSEHAHPNDDRVIGEQRNRAARAMQQATAIKLQTAMRDVCNAPRTGSGPGLAPVGPQSVGRFWRIDLWPPAGKLNSRRSS